MGSGGFLNPGLTPDLIKILMGHVACELLAGVPHEAAAACQAHTQYEKLESPGLSRQQRMWDPGLQCPDKQPAWSATSILRVIVL